MTWAEYEDVWVDPDRVSGAPCLRGTRVPVDAILINYDSFMEEGMSESEAARETFECFPSVDVDRIHALIAFRDIHEDELTA